MTIRNSKAHGEPYAYYRPQHVDGNSFRDNYDAIFRKPDPAPESVPEKATGPSVAIYGRCGVSCHLEPVGPDRYRLISELPISFSSDEHGTIRSVDPSGGPFMSLRELIPYINRFLLGIESGKTGTYLTFTPQGTT